MTTFPLKKKKDDTEIPWYLGNFERAVKKWIGISLPICMANTTSFSDDQSKNAGSSTKTLRSLSVKWFPKLGAGLLCDWDIDHTEFTKASAAIWMLLMEQPSVCSVDI